MPRYKINMIRIARTIFSLKLHSIYPWLFLRLSPNKTVLPILSEYDAERSSDVAARKPNKMLEPRDEVITRNSPTKPEVPGKPEFAIRKKIIIKEKIGMNLETP